MAHHLVAIIDSALGCEVVWCGWNVAVLWGKGSRVVEAVARWEVGVSHGRNRYRDPTALYLYISVRLTLQHYH